MPKKASPEVVKVFGQPELGGGGCAVNCKCSRRSNNLGIDSDVPVKTRTNHQVVEENLDADSGASVVFK